MRKLKQFISKLRLGCVNRAGHREVVGEVCSARSHKAREFHETSMGEQAHQSLLSFCVNNFVVGKTTGCQRVVLTLHDSNRSHCSCYTEGYVRLGEAKRWAFVPFVMLAPRSAHADGYRPIRDVAPWFRKGGWAEIACSFWPREKQFSRSIIPSRPQFLNMFMILINWYITLLPLL